ncbi:MAG: hypothetical protein ABSG36_16315 [Acidimicrobiales bacterium]
MKAPSLVRGGGAFNISLLAAVLILAVARFGALLFLRIASQGSGDVSDKSIQETAGLMSEMSLGRRPGLYGCRRQVEFPRQWLDPLLLISAGKLVADLLLTRTGPVLDAPQGRLSPFRPLGTLTALFFESRAHLLFESSPCATAAASALRPHDLSLGSGTANRTAGVTRALAKMDVVGAHAVPVGAVVVLALPTEP